MRNWLISAASGIASSFVASLLFTEGWQVGGWPRTAATGAVGVLVLVSVWLTLHRRQRSRRGITVQSGGAGSHAASRDVIDDHSQHIGRVGPGGITVTGGSVNIYGGSPPSIPPIPVPSSPLPQQLPSPVRDFTGRTHEIEDLLDAGRRQRGAVISCRGMGGVGKTQLALAIADRIKGNYPDGQVFLDLRGASPEPPLSTADVMAHVIQAFDLQAKPPDEPAQLAAAYRSILAGKRVLLFLDNAASREQVEPLVPPETCLLLVTSRHRFALPGLYAKDLDEMPLGEAEALLRRIAPRIGAAAAEIARSCGRLPLALRAAGSFLAERPDMTPQAYLVRLEDARVRLDFVDASLMLSYESLRPGLRARFRTLAIFEGSFDVSAAAAVWEAGTEEAQEDLAELTRYSLLGFDEKTSRYRLHDLVRVLADSYLSTSDREAAARRHARYYLAVLAFANGLYLKGGENVLNGLALFDLEWPNIEAGQKWAAARADADDEAARLCAHYPNAGAYCIALRLHPRERIVWLEAALVAARRLKDREGEACSLGNLGRAYGDLGDPHKAIEFHEQALVIAREIGDRRGEGNTLGSLGNAYAVLGDPHRAIEFYEKRLSIAREIGDRRGEGNSLGNLGVVYRTLGDARRAIEFYEQHLAIAREIGDRQGEGNTLWNRAVARKELGDRDGAIADAEKALVIFEAIKDPHAAKVREKIAEWRREQK